MERVIKKHSLLLKRLMVEGGVALAVVAALVGIMMVVSAMLETETTAQTGLQNELATVRSEIAQAKERIEGTGKSAAIYSELKQQRDTMDMEIKRELMTGQLAALKERYRLSSLNLQVAPEVSIENDAIKTANVPAIKAAVDISFGGMSDQHLLSFVQQLIRQLPGFVHPNELTLTRTKAFDIDSMRQISQGAEVEMVTGKLLFDWVGLQAHEASKP